METSGTYRRVRRGLAALALVAAIGGISTLYHNPVINPTLSQILAEQKYIEDSQKKLYNYPESQDKPSDLRNLLAGEVLGNIEGRPVVFDANGTARYLDGKEEEVPANVLTDYVKNYIGNYKSQNSK